MSTTSTFLAEEALALPAPQRAELAQLLIDSLEGYKRNDAEILALLETRLQALTRGQDRGMSFDEGFREKP